MSYPWNNFSLKCGLCANRYGMYSERFYKFFDDTINNIKINEVMTRMFPYGNYSRADMDSQIICNCCYTQAEEMFQRDVKWVDCFKEMDDIKNQFSHLRRRDDFDYFLRSTASPMTSSASSTTLTENQYRPISLAPFAIVSGRSHNEDNSSNQPTSSATSTVVSGSTSNEDNSSYQPTSLAPSTSFTRNQYYPTYSVPSTVVSGSTSNEDNSDYQPTSSVPSIIVSESTYDEDDSDNFSTSSESSTTVSENENNEEYAIMMTSTHNTRINIMSNRVYAKSGVFYSCIIPSCRLYFKTFHKFKMHYRHHRNVNGLVCWTCIKILPNRSEMCKHKYKDSCKFPGMFVCALCNESFNDLQSISHHKYIKHIKN